MANDRWSWFTSGVVLGLLIGAGAAGGFAWARIAAARAETKEAKAEAIAERERAVDIAMKASLVPWPSGPFLDEESAKFLEDLAKPQKDR